MAPKVSFSRRQIIEAGLTLVRRDGAGQLTARNVARELGGSTQPIYRLFSNIQELMDCVMEEAGKRAVAMMLEYGDEHSQFLGIGLGYLNFAREEPNLFHLLYMSGRYSFELEGPGSPFGPLTERMRRDPFLASLDEEQLRRLLLDMFIYTHGLTTLSTVKGLGRDSDSARRMLKNMGEKLIILALSDKKTLPHIAECGEENDENSGA